MEIVIFKVNGQPYGMNIDYLEGIEELEHVTPVANAPKFISGISNVRGEIVPVFDLAEKFSLKASDSPQKYLLVRLDKTAVCLAVNEVDGMKTFDDSDVFGVPGIFTEETDYFTKVINIGNNKLALVIAPDMLIPCGEQDDISEFVSKEALNK